MTKIEQVAAAISSVPVECGTMHITGDDAIALAKAAIDAMRKTTKETVESGNEKINECIDFWNYDSNAGYTVETFAANRCWESMIDAALK